MDPFTHGVLGAIAGACVWRLSRRRRVAKRQGFSKRQAVGIGVLAGMFPDIDVVTFLVNPLYYDAYWHGTYTHSLVLAPLWAGLLCLLFIALGRWVNNRACAGKLIFVVCLAAIVSHIATDVLTAWDVGLLMPLLDTRVSLGLLFIIDPLFTLLLLLLLIALTRVWPRSLIVLCLCLPLAWIALATMQKNQALELAQMSLGESAEAPAKSELSAWPQPFSLSHWKLVYSDDKGIWSAHVRLSERQPVDWPLQWLARSAAGYAVIRSTANSLPWRFHPLHPTPTSKEAWHRPEFKAVRDFMTYPVFLFEDNEGCVWFTDWLFTVPRLEPPFQYAACQTQEGNWHIKRGQMPLPWEV